MQGRGFRMHCTIQGIHMKDSAQFGRCDQNAMFHIIRTNLMQIGYYTHTHLYSGIQTL